MSIDEPGLASSSHHTYDPGTSTQPMTAEYRIGVLENQVAQLLQALNEVRAAAELHQIQMIKPAR